MKPAPFEYRRAESVEDAVALLGEDAKPLAGGQSLVPLLNMRLARPALLVDVNDLHLDSEPFLGESGSSIDATNAGLAGESQNTATRHDRTDLVHLHRGHV